MDPSSDKQSLRHVRELQSADDLDSWQIEIYGKLMTDGYLIGDARAQLYYVWGAISRALQKRYFLPFMKKTLLAVTDTSAQDLVNYVIQTLEEPNRQWKAGQRLTKLRQSSSLPSHFIPLFEAALFEAGGDLWPDHAKILLLINGLNAPTREHLDRETWPQSWTWAEFTTSLRRSESRFVSEPKPPPSTPFSDAMDVDIQAASTFSQRRQWQEQGKCRRCGKTGHWAKDCPSDRSRKTGVLAAGTQGLSREQAAGARYEAAQNYRQAFEVVDRLQAFEEVERLDAESDED